MTVSLVLFARRYDRIRVDWELPVNRADVDLVNAVFSALQKYISTYGLTKVDSEKVLGSVPGISQGSPDSGSLEMPCLGLLV